MGRYKLPNALRALGADVQVHADHFDGDTRDEVWMAFAGSQGWVGLSHNKDLLQHEKDAAIQHGLRLFVLTGARGIDDLIHILECTYKRMINYLAANPGPWIVRIHRATEAERKHNPNRSGHIKHWYP